jgi:hypothetical protein
MLHPVHRSLGLWAHAAIVIGLILLLVLVARADTGNTSMAAPALQAAALMLVSVNIRKNWPDIPALCAALREKNWDVAAIKEVGRWSEDYAGDLEKAATDQGYLIYWNLKSRTATAARRATKQPGTRRRGSGRRPWLKPSGGLAFIIRESLVCKMSVAVHNKPSGKALTRLHHLTVHGTECDIHIYNVYAPSGNESKNNQFV